jgi:voltage-gated potassium channel
VPQTLAAVGLTFVNVVVHVSGFFLLAALLRNARSDHVFSHSRRLMVPFLAAIVLLVIVLHLVEVAMWAAFSWWVGSFDDFRTALYFSLGSYSTVGAGELALPAEWRLLAGVEAIVGALMFGLSTALLFTVMNEINHLWRPRRTTEP